MLLKVDGLEKRYRLHRGALSRFLDLSGLGGRKGHETFQALAPLSFEIEEGEALAVVGANGSGKSTLARIVAGISPPSAGRIELRGRAAGLLGLGTGFHPDFTGEQNIRIAARLLGVPSRDIDRRLEETLAFAEIGDFARQAMRTYSAGMVARLGFAVLTAIRPDLFILDEAFSAGDLYFHRKCWESLQRLKDAGMSFLVVTHNLDLARLFCDRCLWLHEGALRQLGPTAEVCLAYEAHHRERRLEGLDDSVPRDDRLHIRKLSLWDEDGQAKTSFAPGSALHVEIEWETKKACPGAVFGLTLHDERGALLWGANNHDLGPGAWKLAPGRGRAVLTLNLGALTSGRYHLTATAHGRPAAPFWSNPDDFHYQRWEFRIRDEREDGGRSVGPIRLEASWRLP